jgi:hypothetical protein
MVGNLCRIRHLNASFDYLTGETDAIDGVDTLGVARLEIECANTTSYIRRSI